MLRVRNQGQGLGKCARLNANRNGNGLIGFCTFTAKIVVVWVFCCPSLSSPADCPARPVTQTVGPFPFAFVLDQGLLGSRVRIQASVLSLRDQGQDLGNCARQKANGNGPSQGQICCSTGTTTTTATTTGRPLMSYCYYYLYYHCHQYYCRYYHYYSTITTRRVLYYNDYYNCNQYYRYYYYYYCQGTAPIGAWIDLPRIFCVAPT